MVQYYPMPRRELPIAIALDMIRLLFLLFLILWFLLLLLFLLMFLLRVLLTICLGAACWQR